MLVTATNTQFGMPSGKKLKPSYHSNLHSGTPTRTPISPSGPTTPASIYYICGLDPYEKHPYNVKRTEGTNLSRCFFHARKGFPLFLLRAKNLHNIKWEWYDSYTSNLYKEVVYPQSVMDEMTFE